MTHPDKQIDPRLLARIQELRPTPERDPEAARQGREQFLREARSLTRPVSESPFKRLKGWFNNFNHPQEKSLMKSRLSFGTALIAVFLALALMLAGGWVTASAARGALPGDSLYSVKTAIEDAQVALSRDAADDAQLHLQFAQTRLDEIAALIAAGRYDDIEKPAAQFEKHLQLAIESLGTVAAGDSARAQELASSIASKLSSYNQILNGMLATVPSSVQPAIQGAIQTSEQYMSGDEIEFTGEVLSIDSEQWQVGDQIIYVTGLTEIDGIIVVGDIVKVHARTDTEGNLIAREIELSALDDDDGNVNDNDVNDNDDDDANDNDDDGNVNDNDVNDNDDDDANDNDDDGNHNDDDANDNDDDDGNHNDDDDANDNDDDDANDNDDDDGNDNDDDDGNDNDDDDGNDNDDDDDDGNDNDDDGDNDNDDDANDNDDDANDNDDDGNDNDDDDD
jgi:hypothetical protein